MIEKSRRAREPSSSGRKSTHGGGSGRDSSDRRDRSVRKSSPTAIVARMREQFVEITGRDVETVSALNSTEQGWELHVEVVELARIPDTTSVLGCYLVRLDEDGGFVGYERLRRYTRGQTEL